MTGVWPSHAEIMIHAEAAYIFPNEKKICSTFIIETD